MIVQTIADMCGQHRALFAQTEKAFSISHYCSEYCLSKTERLPYMHTIKETTYIAVGFAWRMLETNVIGSCTQ